MTPPLPAAWIPIIGAETRKPYFSELSAFVEQERARYQVFPPEEDVFNALRYTPYEQIRVVILGQDPYHDDNQAHGLAFSVRPGIQPPPSLRNIFKELHTDTGFRIPNHGYLVPWAQQGVFLLNAVLTVRAHQAASHKNKGWEVFTDAILKAVNDLDQRVVFLLWGSFAQKKAEFINNPVHMIFQAPHPSPLSAARGFFGCRHFSKANSALQEAGREVIDWHLPDLPKDGAKHRD